MRMIKHRKKVVRGEDLWEAQSRVPARREVLVESQQLRAVQG